MDTLEQVPTLVPTLSVDSKLHENLDNASGSLPHIPCLAYIRKKINKHFLAIYEFYKPCSLPEVQGLRRLSGRHGAEEADLFCAGGEARRDGVKQRTAVTRGVPSALEADGPGCLNGVQVLLLVLG